MLDFLEIDSHSADALLGSTTEIHVRKAVRKAGLAWEADLQCGRSWGLPVLTESSWAGEDFQIQSVSQTGFKAGDI